MEDKRSTQPEANAVETARMGQNEAIVDGLVSGRKELSNIFKLESVIQHPDPTLTRFEELPTAKDGKEAASVQMLDDGEDLEQWRGEQDQEIGSSVENSQSDLESWYDEYAKADNFESIQTSLAGDELDLVAIESEIQALVKCVTVSSGFCIACQNLHNNWSGITQDIQKEPYELTRPFLNNTLELEAGYRNGCRFCALNLQELNTRPENLPFLRKIERRLNLIQKATTLYAIIWEDVDYKGRYFMRMSLPGHPSTEFLLPGGSCVYAIPRAKSNFSTFFHLRFGQC
jgi:hypothetical protein